MVTMTATPPRAARMITVPSRKELRAMLTDPAVFRTVVRCATVFGSLALAAVVFLAYTGHETAVVGTLIGGPLVALLTTIASRFRQVHDVVKTVQQQQAATEDQQS